MVRVAEQYAEVSPRPPAQTSPHAPSTDYHYFRSISNGCHVRAMCPPFLMPCIMFTAVESISLSFSRFYACEVWTQATPLN